MPDGTTMFDRDDGWRRAWTQGFVALVVFAFVGLYFWQSDKNRHAVADLDAADRRALYQRTMQTLETVCADRPDAGLVEMCREQAEIVIALPECDAHCHEVARSAIARATR